MQSTNPFEKFVAKAVEWVRGHQEQFWAMTGATLLAALLIGLVLHHRETESTEAWSQLGTIQGQLIQGKLEDAHKALDGWETRFRGTDAATYGKFMKADLLYRTSDYIQAAQVYGDLTQTAKPELMKPLALSAAVSSEEMAGRIPQAQGLAQSFLEHYPDHFLAGPMYMSQARLAEMAGNPAAAAAIYEKFIILFPQSPWTALAQTRTKALGGSASKK